MTPMSVRHWLPALVIAGLVAVVGYQAGASRPAAIEPARIATVDIQFVFQGLNRRQAADDRLVALATELDEEATGLKEEIEALNNDLEIFPAGSAKHQELLEQIGRVSFDLSAHLEFASQKLDREKARTLRVIYADIKSAVAAWSRQNGVDLVVVNDAVVPVPRDASENETMRQISARRLLYSDSVIDISREMINFMNSSP